MSPDLNGMYVYIAENNTLKKQYVTTGKTLWGYEIEILSGLTMEDYIAFPYGKHVHEGAQAVVSENMPMY